MTPKVGDLLWDSYKGEIGILLHINEERGADQHRYLLYFFDTEYMGRFILETVLHFKKEWEKKLATSSR
jgi:hypothetical protein